jgi:hypothetical protein
MKYVLAAVVVAAVAFAIYFLSCNGHGGPGLSTSTSATGSSVPKRCDVRVAAAGITVDGKPATRAEAVTLCKNRPGADVVVTGDARQGDWDDLRAAFDASGITIYVRR